MSEWWRHLTGRPFYWVLDGTHPPADLFMLRHVVERPDGARGLEAARLALRESPQVAALIAALDQPGAGLWSPRYQTPFWALRLLAEIGTPGDDERLAETLHHILDRSGDGELEPPPVNLNAIMLHMVLAFGYDQDERVGERLARLRDELERHELPPTPPALADWLTQAALALAEAPPGLRDPAILELLTPHLASLNPATLDRYAAYNFPLFDQPNDLALARAALQLGIAGPWLEPWVARIEAAQDDEGLWRMTRALPTPAAVTWEPPGPSRWISAQAMYVLRAWYGEGA